MCLTVAERNSSVQETNSIYQSMSALCFQAAGDTKQTGAHLGGYDSTLGKAAFQVLPRRTVSQYF